MSYNDFSVPDYCRGVPVTIVKPHKNIKRPDINYSESLENILFDDYKFDMEKSVLEWTKQDRMNMRAMQIRIEQRKLSIAENISKKTKKQSPSMNVNKPEQKYNDVSKQQSYLSQSQLPHNAISYPVSTQPPTNSIPYVEQNTTPYPRSTQHPANSLPYIEQNTIPYPTSNQPPANTLPYASPEQNTTPYPSSTYINQQLSSQNSSSVFDSRYPTPPPPPPPPALPTQVDTAHILPQKKNYDGNYYDGRAYGTQINYGINTPLYKSTTTLNPKPTYESSSQLPSTNSASINYPSHDAPASTSSSQPKYPIPSSHSLTDMPSNQNGYTRPLRYRTSDQNQNNNHTRDECNEIMQPVVIVQSTNKVVAPQKYSLNNSNNCDFDVKDFEKCADAFEDVTLKSINDIQELKSVLCEQAVFIQQSSGQTHNLDNLQQSSSVHCSSSSTAESCIVETQSSNGQHTSQSNNPLEVLPTQSNNPIEVLSTQSNNPIEVLSTQSNNPIEVLSTQSNNPIEVLSTQSNNPIEVLSTQSNNPIEVLSTQSNNPIEVLSTQSNNTIEVLPTQSNNPIEVLSTQSNNTIEVLSTQSNNPIEVLSTQSNNPLEVLPTQSNDPIEVLPPQSNNPIKVLSIEDIDPASRPTSRSAFSFSPPLPTHLNPPTQPNHQRRSSPNHRSCPLQTLEIAAKICDLSLKTSTDNDISNLMTPSSSTLQNTASTSSLLPDALSYNLSCLDNCLPDYTSTSELSHPSPSSFKQNNEPHTPASSPIQFECDSDELPAYSVINPYPVSDTEMRFIDNHYKNNSTIQFRNECSSNLQISAIMEELGVNKSRVERVLTYSRGTDINKIRDVIILEDDLIMKGFSQDDIVTYLLDVNNSESNAEKYLTLLQHLRDCGFTDEQIITSLKKCSSLNASEALDHIYNATSSFI